MLTSYSRVTVVSGSRRVDLALPSALPVANVVPQVLRFCAPEESPELPNEFTLARVGGPSLALSQSLAEAGVRDGDVIELRVYGADPRPAYVEDVRDAIEDAVDGAGGQWDTRATVTFAVVATSAVLLVLVVGPLLGLVADGLSGRSPEAPEMARTLSRLVAAGLLVGLSAVAARWAAPWATYVSTWVAAALAFLAGVELVARHDDPLSAALTAGAAAALAVGAVCRVFTPRATVLLAASAVATIVSSAVLLTGALGGDSAIAVRVVATVAVLAVGVMPRLSIAVGGLSTADYRVRNAGQLSESALHARLRESAGLLMGSVLGVAAVVAVVGFWLGLRDEAWEQDVWDRVLSLSLAAALLLRSRVFSRVRFMLPLRVAALVVLLGTVLEVASDSAALQQWLLTAVAFVGAVAVGVSLLSLSDISRARVKRYLNVAEFIVIVDLVVVTMGAVGLYDWATG